jgi:O-succinylbenzoate synthase
VECNALVRASAPSAVAAEVERVAAEGFRVFKLKAANRGGPLDCERLGGARWAAGAAACLRIDFNAALTAAQAAGALPGLRGFRPELIEQPLPESEPARAWVELAAGSGLDLAADESLVDPALARDLAGHGVGLAIKLGSLGGPQAALELAAAASGRVLLASSYESSIGIAAALHTACALSEEPMACGLATARLLEADLASGLAFEGAWLRLPDGPGLGVELDLRALDRYRLDR